LKCIEPGIAYGLDEFDCICKKDGKRIAVSNHAKSHMIYQYIKPETLCDMIRSPIPAGSSAGKPHRKNARRVCSMHKKVKYNIVLDPFVINDEACWVIANMEPVT
jgi:hypothetical protein